MTDATIWQSGERLVPVINTAGQIQRQTLTALASQTVFVLTEFNYTPSTDTLFVYTNGELELQTAYVENNATTITFLVGKTAGQKIELVAYAINSINVGTVFSVAGKTGIVVLNKADVSLTNVDNTTDLSKPVSTPTQTAIDVIPSVYNFIDNSIFTINQRDTIFPVTLSAAAYAHDRWKAGSGGCNYTILSTINGINRLSITAGTLLQIIPGVDVDLPTAPVTFTLSWKGTAQGRINAGALSASPHQLVVGASTSLTVEFSTGTLQEPQLIIGSKRYELPVRNDHQERIACRRYFRVFKVADNAIFLNVLLPSMLSNVIVVGFPIDPPMESPPLSSFSNFKYVCAAQSPVGGTFVVVSTAFDASSKEYASVTATLNCTSVSGTFGAVAYLIPNNPGTPGKIFLTCEL